MESEHRVGVCYLSQVHQVSNLIFKTVSVFTVVLQNEVLSTKGTSHCLYVLQTSLAGCFVFKPVTFKLLLHLITSELYI